MAKKSKLNLEMLEIETQNVQPTIETVTESGVSIQELIATKNFKELFDQNITDVIEEGNKSMKKVSTNKFDPERERQISNGIKLILENNEFFQIAPEALMLAFIWEHKDLRSIVKNNIYKEADSKGLHGYDYLANVLGGNISNLSDIAQAIMRLNYSVITYFKPRNEVVKKGKTVSINLGSEHGVYMIDENVLMNLRMTCKDDKELLKSEIIKFGSSVEENVIEL